MPPFEIRPLGMNDAQALLAFETRNRAWFESRIEPRAPAFYSPAGVAEHIGQYLQAHEAGLWHPFVIESASGEIVGRANLKNIDHATRSAEVGYRVDERFCGQGIASMALRHLIVQAQVAWRLSRLEAYVYDTNAASQRVLERCGFSPRHPPPEQASQRERVLVLTLGGQA